MCLLGYAPFLLICAIRYLKIGNFIMLPIVHNIYTEGECPTLVYPVQTHCIKLWCNISVYSCLLSDKINTTKKVSINKHGVKAKPMRLWKHSQNQLRHCKSVLFCINALIFDAHEPCRDRWVPVSSLRGELKYKVLLFLQRNDDGTHTIWPAFNWKSAFASLLTKAWAAFFTVE